MILSNFFHHGIYITCTLPRVVVAVVGGQLIYEEKMAERVIWSVQPYYRATIATSTAHCHQHRSLPPAPLIATSTAQSEGNTLRKCLDSFSRQSTSVASCSSCPVPFQGASVLPVAHTRPYKSTREKQPWQSIGLVVVLKCSVSMKSYGEKSTSRLCA